MARVWPWSHGSESAQSTTYPSARARLQEAIAEARSSLEHFSGIEARSRGLRLEALLLALRQRLAVARERSAVARGPIWGQGRVWPQVRLRAAARPAGRLTFSWPRLAAHLGLLCLVALLVWSGGLGGVLARPVQANEGLVSLAWQWLQPAGESSELMSAYASIPAMPIVLQRPLLNASNPFPDYSEAVSVVPLRAEVITYTVQAGDTLISIAAQFDLSIETLYWLNGLKSADLLSIGQELKIPPVNGLRYEVQEGDTLDSIAEEFKVRKGNMIAYGPNNLREPYTLQVGQEIYVPGASKPIPRPAVTLGTRPSYVRLVAPTYAALPGGERFSWPAQGRITDRFGWTGTRWHTGLDIAAPWGTPVYSAAAGTVTAAGWNGSLGYTVSIDHGDGWETRYGHLAQQPEVSEGSWVDRGQLIGFIGCTGWCTGPHVHFEVRFEGAYTDPLDYLQ